jgi:predicted nuclease of predicted toxin-antitoxin system
MKLLLDACVWGGSRAVLETAGHDVVWAGDWARDPGDDEILAQAHREERILVTLDKDFGELAIVKGLPHGGIVRLAQFAAEAQGPICLQVLETHGPALLQGAIVTAEPGRLRIRPPEATSANE